MPNIEAADTSTSTKRIIIVDDLRNFPFGPTDDGHTFRTSEAALTWLQDDYAMTRPAKVLDELWLDFDLGGDDTAMPIALWLAEVAYYGAPYPVEKIVIHSANPVGSEAMHQTLTRFGYTAIIVDAHFGV